MRKIGKELGVFRRERSLSSRSFSLQRCHGRVIRYWEQETPATPFPQIIFRFIMSPLGPIFVRSCYNPCQLAMMSVVAALLWRPIVIEHPSAGAGPFVRYGLPLAGRFRLSLCLARAGCDDLHRVDGPPQLVDRVICLRRTPLPRMLPAGQGGRSGLYPCRHGVFVAGFEGMIYFEEWISLHIFAFKMR